MKLPVAVNCSGAPGKIVALPGVMVIDVRLACVTVRIAGTLVVTVPNAAVMEVVPTPTDVASPLMFPALLMAATEPADELQTTNAVISRVVLSVKVPIAVNCSVVPRAI